MSFMDSVRATLFGTAGAVNPLDATTPESPSVPSKQGAETTGVNPDTATKAMNLFLAMLGTSALFITVTVLMTHYPDISSAVGYSLFGGLSLIAISGMIYQICTNRNSSREIPASLPTPPVAAPSSVPKTAPSQHAKQASTNPFDLMPTDGVIVQPPAQPPAQSVAPKPALSPSSSNTLSESAAKAMSIFGIILGISIVGLVITILMVNYPDISSAVSYALFGGLGAISLGGIIYKLCTRDDPANPQKMSPPVVAPPIVPAPTA